MSDLRLVDMKKVNKDLSSLSILLFISGLFTLVIGFSLMIVNLIYVVYFNPNNLELSDTLIIHGNLFANTGFTFMLMLLNQIIMKFIIQFNIDKSTVFKECDEK